VDALTRHAVALRAGPPAAAPGKGKRPSLTVDTAHGDTSKEPDVETARVGRQDAAKMVLADVFDSLARAQEEIMGQYAASAAAVASGAGGGGGGEGKSESKTESKDGRSTRGDKAEKPGKDAADPAGAAAAVAGAGAGAAWVQGTGPTKWKEITFVEQTAPVPPAAGATTATAAAAATAAASKLTVSVQWQDATMATWTADLTAPGAAGGAAAATPARAPAPAPASGTGSAAAAEEDALVEGWVADIARALSAHLDRHPAAAAATPKVERERGVERGTPGKGDVAAATGLLLPVIRALLVNRVGGVCGALAAGRPPAPAGAAPAPAAAVALAARSAYPTAPTAVAVAATVPLRQGSAGTAYVRFVANEAAQHAEVVVGRGPVAAVVTGWRPMESAELFKYLQDVNR